MPVYNAAATIDRAARSILDGDWQDLELIIVDDGSDEPVVEPRARVIRTPHRGIVSALNAGIAEARAPVIARMDADDYAHPTRLTQQMPMLDEADIVGCAVNIVGPRRQAVESMRRYERWINENLDAERIAAMRFVESPLVHPTVLAKREVFELGYREGPFPEDYDLWLRYRAEGKRFAKVPEILHYWREHGQRATHTNSRYSVENFLRAKAHYLCAGPLAQRDGVVVWGAGKTGRRIAKHLERGGCAPEVFVDVTPKKIGSTLRGKPVISPDDLPVWWRRYTWPILLVAVASRGARVLIREYLGGLHMVEGEDYLCVA